MHVNLTPFVANFATLITWEKHDKYKFYTPAHIVKIFTLQTNQHAKFKFAFFPNEDSDVGVLSHLR